MLAMRSFKILHVAAWHAGIPDSDWDHLDKILPHGSVWDYWDRCDRLRRGLLKAFDNFGWPVLGFADISNDPLLFRYVIVTAKETKPGQRVLNTLRRDLRQHKFRLPRELEDIL
jgi:hypothetical protein